MYDNRWDNIDSDSEELKDAFNSNRVISAAMSEANLNHRTRTYVTQPTKESNAAEEPKPLAPTLPLTEADEKEQNREVKNENDEEEEDMCRYCFGTGGRLIAPCKCTGSQKWVHEKCLRKWQRICQVRKSTHPWFQEQSDTEEVCNVCATKFDLKPQNYDQLVRGLTGEQIVSRVREGFLIVRTQESSERSRLMLLTNGHIPLIQQNLTPWISGVYLITGISMSESTRGDDLICAVNLAKELHVVPPRYARHANSIIGKKKVIVKHMDSGPCDGLHSVGCLKSTTRQHVDEWQELKVMDDMPGGLAIAGPLRKVVEISHEDWLREDREKKANSQKPEPSPASRLVYACWGDGTWSRTQLIGEIARGGWGMAVFKSSDAFKVDGQPDPPGPDGLFMKIHRENRPIAPEENEMSRAFEEPLEARPFRDTDEAREHRERLRAQLLANNQQASASMDISTCEDNEEEPRVPSDESNPKNDKEVEMSMEEKGLQPEDTGSEDIFDEL